MKRTRYAKTKIGKNYLTKLSKEKIVDKIKISNFKKRSDCSRDVCADRNKQAAVWSKRK